MLFPTLDFALFFMVVFAVSWKLRRAQSLRKLFLVLASYFFYGYWDWRFTLLLFCSTLINYLAGDLLAVSHPKYQKFRKAIVAIAVILNLTILGFFKYYGFFLENLDDLLRSLNLERDLIFLEIILPVGISFFTFQGMSYVIDVYRKQIKPVTSILDLFLYISFFPQLVAGPIVRARHFLPQLNQPPQLTRRMVSIGIVLILIGLFKKMVIANYLSTVLVDQVFFDPSQYSAGDILLAVYGYAVQIYCDFSGYSDIAIGVAALLGYRFNRNFNQPYRARSLQDFWRRWHISLSTWLRDYLYKPLGGSHGTPAQTRRNLMITMVLGGIWHGATWTFIVWGLIHGAGLLIERTIRQSLTTPARQLTGYGGGLAGMVMSVSEAGGRGIYRILSPIITFHFVCLAWIFFRSQTFTGALEMLNGLVTRFDPPSLATPFIVLLVTASILSHFLPPDMIQRTAMVIRNWNALWLGLLLGIGIFLIHAIAPPGVAPFIYFQF